MNSPQWEKGKRVSLSFYKKKLRFKEAQFNHPFNLSSYFAPMIGEKRQIMIADLGAGIFSTIGTRWDTAGITMYASDLLADEYAKILTEADILPLVPVEKQDMEHLTYSENFFDIVHCTNALDHCTDPEKAILEMYRVCKPGGWIYLRHYAHVGKHQNYCGLHAWNIDAFGENDCRIWNKKGGFFLSSISSEFRTVSKREMPYEPENMVVSTLQKPI